MKYFAQLTERRTADPQEARAMAEIRMQSINWMRSLGDVPAVEYVFRDEHNRASIFFLDFDNHAELHRFLDGDPLVSYCSLELEPLLTTIEMVSLLSEYLSIDPSNSFTPAQLDELTFPRRPIDPDGSYFIARKTVAPFSPLLSLDVQDKIHLNTLAAQRAHADNREICDYNPVSKPVGILVMEADTWEEVIEHVADCEVYVDSVIDGSRLLTVRQASERATAELARYCVGEFRK